MMSLWRNYPTQATYMSIIYVSKIDLMMIGVFGHGKMSHKALMEICGEL